MQEKTYTELYNLIVALAGVGNFTATEQVYITAFVNRRAYEAYQLSASWPRFLTVGEARTVVSPQTIEYTESGLNTIGQFLRIHDAQPFLRNSANEFEFYVDSTGAHILNLTTTDTTTAYVTYKAEFTPYTSASTDFPFEFFQYTAHAAYADFLRMDGQHEKAFAEESVGREYLQIELEKIDNISNNNTITRRFSTHLSRQSR